MVIAGFKIIKTCSILPSARQSKADAVNAVIRFAYKRLFSPRRRTVHTPDGFIGQGVKFGNSFSAKRESFQVYRC